MKEIKKDQVRVYEQARSKGKVVTESIITGTLGTAAIVGSGIAGVKGTINQNTGMQIASYVLGSIGAALASKSVSNIANEREVNKLKKGKKNIRDLDVGNS